MSAENMRGLLLGAVAGIALAGAAGLAFAGVDGWGWFLVAAILAILGLAL